MAFLRRRTRERDEPTDDIDFTDSVDAFAELIDREWGRLAHAGTWLTGLERVEIAAEARRAIHGAPAGGTLPPPHAEAARRVAVDAATIRPDDIARWGDDGLDEWTYVELVGVVSRLAAIDVATFGLGWSERDLPAPVEGEPSRIRPDDAEVTTGWVPTVGPASAPSALSAVTAEHDAMFAVHSELYLSIMQMGELDIVRDGLTRPQMELVAARTSMLNDCFY